MKQPYPFYPLEDSLLGQILAEIYTDRDRLDELKSKFTFYLEEGHPSFYFTPKSTKSSLLTILPNQFRNLFDRGDNDKILEKFQSLLKPPVNMDVVLEILEWIITGLSSKETSFTLLKELLKDESLELTLIDSINEKYIKYLQSESA